MNEPYIEIIGDVAESLTLFADAIVNHYCDTMVERDWRMKLKSAACHIRWQGKPIKTLPCEYDPLLLVSS